jgi:hypothetical protein
MGTSNGYQIVRRILVVQLHNAYGSHGRVIMGIVRVWISMNNIGMHLNHRHKTHIVCYLEAAGVGLV